MICTFGPHDRPFAERHDGVCVAAVIRGTFQYRSTLGSAVLAPGALLLGNEHHAFECRHEHGTGDRCLSFQLTPEFLEGVVAAVPGVRRIAFSAPRLPPHPLLLPIVAAAEAAREDDDAAAFEEVALRRIEAQADKPLALAELARGAAMSPYHFLRTFVPWRMTPPIHPAHAAPSRSSTPAPDGRQHFRDRVRGRLQRSVNVQLPLSADHGAKPSTYRASPLT